MHPLEVLSPNFFGSVGTSHVDILVNVINAFAMILYYRLDATCNYSYSINAQVAYETMEGADHSSP